MPCTRGFGIYELAQSLKRTCSLKLSTCGAFSCSQTCARVSGKRSESPDVHVLS